MRNPVNKTTPVNMFDVRVPSKKRKRRPNLAEIKMKQAYEFNPQEDYED